MIKKKTLWKLLVQIGMYIVLLYFLFLLKFICLIFYLIILINCLFPIVPVKWQSAAWRRNISWTFFITLPAGVATKYCGQYVCVCSCVCLSVHEDISRTTCAIFTKFFVRVAYVRGSVLLRHVDRGAQRGRSVTIIPTFVTIIGRINSLLLKDSIHCTLQWAAPSALKNCPFPWEIWISI